MPEEVTPINPDVGDKLIKVNMTYQTLSAFEGSREVYFARSQLAVLMVHLWVISRFGAR